MHPKLRYYVPVKGPTMSTPMSSPEGSVKYCPACETRLPIAAAACHICGHVFDAAQAAPEAVGVPAQPQPVDPASTTVIAPQPTHSEPPLAPPEFTAAFATLAIPGRSIWLIGLVSAVAVLLLSLAVLIFRPQFGAQATAPPPTVGFTLHSTVQPAVAAPNTPTAVPATATVAPTDTPLPRASAAASATATVVASPTALPGRVIGAVPSVALRSGAGTQFVALRQLPPGQGVVMQCQVSGNIPAAFATDGSDKWVRVSVEGVAGFVYSALLETSGPLSECGPAQ